MNNNFKMEDNINTAQDYYPKSINLGQQKEYETAHNPQSEQPKSPQNNFSSFSSPFSNMFSSDNLFSQLLGGLGGFNNLGNLSQLSNNPLLSSLLSSNNSQADMLSKLMSSLMPKKDKAEPEKEKIIDISNSIEEL